MIGSKGPRERSVLATWARLATLAGLVLAAVPAAAQSQWELNRGNCDSILSTPQFYSLEQVRDCAQRWESYGHPDAISRAEAEAYARGFSRLYHQGTRRDQTLAESALARLGLSVLSGGDFIPDERLERFLNRDRSPIHVVESGSRERRRARERNSDGMREYNRGRYDAAASEFRAALDIDPFYILAKYNLACQLALLGDYDESLRHLSELQRWDSPEAQEQFTHALTDEDFVAMRDDVRFRLLTGYARVQILNGAGQAGVARVTEVRDALLAQGYDIASFGHDRYSRARPTVWYARGYEEISRSVAAMVAEGTQTRPIDWGTDFDLVVVWGAAAQPGQLAAPLVQGRLFIESGDPEEAAEDVEATAEDVQEVIEEPEAAAEEWQPPF